MLDELAQRAQVRTAKGIAQAVSGMVSTGVLDRGTQLPTVRTVARHLGISVKTAENHRARVLDKLGVRNTVELVRYALRKRLLD